MNKAVFLVILLLLSCNKSDTIASRQLQPLMTSDSSQNQPFLHDEEEKAKKWLISALENFFSKESQDAAIITTPDYFTYKTDAIGVVYDGNISEKQFHEKWDGKFDTSKAGIGNGFFISGQDWGRIKVVKCDLLDTKDKTQHFVVVLRDLEFKQDYHREIFVEKINDHYLISDVKEMD